MEAILNYKDYQHDFSKSADLLIMINGYVSYNYHITLQTNINDIINDLKSRINIGVGDVKKIVELILEFFKYHSQPIKVECDLISTI
jgi:hypothetical protein